VKCSVTIRREAGALVARCGEYPACEGRGATAPEAVERLRTSVLFWLEACPCDTTADAGLVMQVVRDETRG
jgi:hypothetical protein